MNLSIQNTQQTFRIETSRLREILTHTVSTEFSEFDGEACFHLVGERRMAEVNWEYLQHEGPTDVITFDLAEDPQRRLFLAEIYICPAVAQEQAGEFETSWQDELVRYHVHALLHLKGFDDLTDAERSVMKKEEERIMVALRAQFDLNAIEHD